MLAVAAVLAVMVFNEVIPIKARNIQALANSWLIPQPPRCRASVLHQNVVSLWTTNIHARSCLITAPVVIYSSL